MKFSEALFLMSQGKKMETTINDQRVVFRVNNDRLEYYHNKFNGWAESFDLIDELMEMDWKELNEGNKQ